jgi:hypothetical protein
MWVAVGDGNGTDTQTIKYSYDGLIWNNITSGGFSNNSASSIYPNGIGRGVAWNGSMWVAVGNGGLFELNSILYSYNGSNWNNISTGGFSGYDQDYGTIYNGNGVAWNGYMWVAVGSGLSEQATIQYSYNGINWSNVTTGGFYDNSGFNQGNGVAWNGSMWVAVGTGSSELQTIQYSYNGINWSNITSGGFDVIGRSVSWNGSMWVAVGSNSAANNIIYSYDGLNWFSSSGNFGGGGGGFCVAYSQTLTPDISSKNLNFYLQNQPTYLRSTHQILATQSTLVINNTMYIDKTNYRIGINKPLPAYTLDVNGTINASLGVLSNGTFLTSDSNLKENIVPADLSQCYSNVKNIPLRRFNYISSIVDSKIDKSQIGFIAQELQTYFPRSVVSLNDIYHVNYDQTFLSHFGATQLLISTVEAKQSTIRSQEIQILTLETTFNTLFSQVSTLVSQRAERRSP